MKPHKFLTILAALLLTACGTFAVGVEHPTVAPTPTDLPEITATTTATPLAAATEPSTRLPSPTVPPRRPGVTPTLTPVPAATDIPAITPPPTEMLSGQSLSPNGEYTAVGNMSRVVITARDGRVGVVFSSKWFSFVGWTADSQYAIMNYYDQYGNEEAVVFDTTQWKEFWIPTVSCRWGMTQVCRQGAVKIIPDGPSILLADGRLVNLREISASDQNCFSPSFFLWPVACADEAPVIVPASEQAFEKGRMLWLQNGPDQAGGQIYVLLANGEAEIYHDTWTTAEPESDPGIAPPSGQYQPVMGFGKVWRTVTLGTGQSVREALGWAVAPEQSYSGLYQRASAESGSNLYEPAPAESARGIYLRAADRRTFKVFLPQEGTHTRWESVAPCCE
jgi:hypothetical protein